MHGEVQSCDSLAVGPLALLHSAIWYGCRVLVLTAVILDCFLHSVLVEDSRLLAVLELELSYNPCTER